MNQLFRDDKNKKEIELDDILPNATIVSTRGQRFTFWLYEMANKLWLWLTPAGRQARREFDVHNSDRK